ncbi:hypothetical protein IWX83_002700, partial [Flavobacterium sp. CG_9.1]|uniref:hypothetical protein n=1 Tax=Flavobacterium sp. CG_9.1 TaxID=2787728 RepID=UPI001A24E1A8
PNLSLKSGISSTGIRTSFLLERVAHHQLVYPFHNLVHKVKLLSSPIIEIKDYKFQEINFEL